MQSRDRAAPLHRARRGLAGARRHHHSSDPHAAPARRHRPPTIASPSRVSDAAGHSVCKLHTRNAARRREGWCRPPPPPPPTDAASPPPPPPRTLYIRGFHPPPATVSDVHYDPRAAASALARRAAGRCLIAGTRPAALRVLVCVCACVFVRVRGWRDTAAVVVLAAGPDDVVEGGGRDRVIKLPC